MKKVIGYCKYYLWAFFMALVFTLSACSSLEGVNTENQSVRILIQYSVLKASEESDNINRNSILAVTNKIRSILNQQDSGNQNITLAYINSEIKDYISYSSLQPSDKLLVDVLMLNIQSVISNRIETDVIDADTKASVLEIIDLIEQAAYLTE